MTLDDVAWVRRLALSGSARAIRQASGISLPEMAAEVGVSPSTVWRWERGDRRPGTVLARKWATALKGIGA